MIKLSLLLIFFSLLLNISSIFTYPEASIDESWASSNSIAIFNNNFESINLHYFPQKYGVPFTMNFLLGLTYRLFGVNLINGRVMIFLISISLLVLTYKTTKNLYGAFTGLTAVMYLASTNSFLYSSHIIRNDLPMAFIILLAFYSFTLYKKCSSNKYLFLSGFLLSYSTEIHQNGIIALASFFIILLFEKRKSLKNFFPFVSGSILYFGIYLLARVAPNVEMFLFEKVHTTSVTHTLPFLSFNPELIVSSELDRYLSYFYPYRFVEAIIILFLMFLGIFSRNYYIRFITKFLFLSSLLFFLFSSNKSSYYFIYFFPFLAIMTGYQMVNFPDFTLNHFDKKSLINMNKIFKILIFVIVILNIYSIFSIYRNNKNNDFQTVLPELRKYAPKNSLILGSPKFFLPLYPDYRYRSYLILSWDRIFENKSIRESIKGINPDYILFDPSFEYKLVTRERMIFESHNLPREEFVNFLEENTLKVFEGYFEGFGKLELYKVL